MNKKKVKKIKDEIENNSEKQPDELNIDEKEKPDDLEIDNKDQLDNLDIDHKEIDELLKKKDENKQKIDVFKDIAEIDENAAVLLYDNGYTSIEKLKNVSLKDICNLTNINKKRAKK